MRLLANISILALFASTAYCQAATPERHLLSQEEMIRRIIEDGIVEGQMEKHIIGMGDAAAVIITKILSDKDVSADNIYGALTVLTFSFTGARGIEIVSDRKPRTALFVLRYLDSRTQDPKVKKEIAHTREYLQTEYTNYINHKAIDEP